MVHKARSGQAMVEYVLALATLLVIVSIMGYFVTAAQKSAQRTEALVSMDCP